MKLDEIRAMSSGDLATKMKDLSEEYFRLRFQHGVRPLDNPAQLRKIKKDIARMKTVITERNIAG
ncbi:MAG: 50S ribosomal protein L29 [Thermodesulfobacteriota bacterium]